MSVAPTPTTTLRGLRRAAVIVIIGSLVITAILGIVALLGVWQGDLPGRILVTTLAIAAFSVTALCHLAIVRRELRIVGYIGLIVSLAALIPALVLIWGDLSWDGMGFWWRSLGVLTILACSLAHANLLLLLADRPRPVVRMLLVITVVLIGVVALLLLLPILTDGAIPGDQGELYWRLLGIVAILDVLGTITLPILGLVTRRDAGGHPPVAAAPAPAAAAPHAAMVPAPAAAAPGAGSATIDVERAVEVMTSLRERGVRTITVADLLGAAAAPAGDPGDDRPIAPAL